MEMYQVRYFLALGRTLNFTRAAQECDVAQPSLSRAIKQLEGELGGELFRRERPQALLTELGRRMLPILKQCFDSASSASALAASVKQGGVGALRIALAHSVELALLTPHVDQLGKLFGGLRLTLLRAGPPEAFEAVRNGDVDIAFVARPADEPEQFDRWPLFDESFMLGCSRNHRLANRPAVEIEDLRNERFVFLGRDEGYDRIAVLMRDRGVELANHHETSCKSDLMQLLADNICVAVLPDCLSAPESLVRLPVVGLDFRRTLCVYAMSGRERTAPVSTFVKLLRGADWSRSVNPQAA